MRNLSFFLAAAVVLWNTALNADDLWLGVPPPGSVYVEVATHQDQQDWRVTNPMASDPRPHRHLPNPILTIHLDSLEGAVRAEAILDRWGGHYKTLDPRIRFNGHPWLDVPFPRKPPAKVEPQRQYFHDNPVIPIPLEYLVEGVNSFQATTSHENPEGWGQWGLYSLILRVYYDPEKVSHPSGRIVSPKQGATMGENPTIAIEASSRNGVAQVDVLAWYEGYDENGDGVWLDWHGGNFQPVRGEPADLMEHVGTLWRAPYEITWDTRWVPDQAPGKVKLVARILDSLGTWTVTEPVEGLSLERVGESVQLFKPGPLPERFGVRTGREMKFCMISLPPDLKLYNILEAGLHLRTWHGWDGHHKPFKLNAWSHSVDGKNHHYDYDIHLVPPAELVPGDNRFEVHSETVHHSLEVLWPGPALTVRFQTDR